MQDTAAEISKAAQLLNWKPTTPPEHGFRLTAQWHSANAGWLEEVVL